VLGESVLSATVGIQEVATSDLSAELVAVAVGGLLVAFGAWWIYFDQPGHLTPTPAMAVRWGMLHVVVFAALAALGAGLQVAAEAVAGDVPARTGSLAVAIPIAAYLIGLVLLIVATRGAHGPVRIVHKLAGAAALVVVAAAGSVSLTMAAAAIVMAVLVALMVAAGRPPSPATI
jgi:low temperature requirement protein LtrA